jgi:ArsR family transcriptional regulator
VSNEIRKLKSELLQALGHPTRIAIVEELRGGEMTAGALSGKLGLDQANASQHLAVLRSRLVVSHRKEGSQVIYSLKDPALGEVLDLLRRICRSRLEESSNLLNEMGEGSAAAR